MKSLILIFIIPATLFAQITEEINLDQLSDNLAMSIDAELEDEGNIENYAQLLAHATDLNRAGPEQLRLLKILTESQIQNLLKHREVHGKLVSIHELQSINEFDPETIRHLQKFAVVKDPSLTLNGSIFQRILNDGENYFMLRYDHFFENKKGFSSGVNENQKFLGSPGRMAWRFRSHMPGDFSFGITAEKDPGERITWSPATHQYGFDYLSVHAQVQNKGPIRNLIVGDFQAQFAQGLIWGGSMGFGKGAETITSLRRTNIGFIPYTSAYEAGNLRGLAASVTLSKNITVSNVISATRRDASIQADEGSVSSFQRTGLHRNRNELDKRKTITERIAGTTIQYETDNFSSGIVLQHVEFGAPVEPRQYLYNHYAFKGSTNTNAGCFINYTLANLSFFSEVAQTFSGGNAFISGALISLSKRFDLAVSYRRFDKDYQSFYANAFSENTRPQNETGVYWGWKYKFPRKIQYTGYLDLFRFPGLKFRTYAPTDGYEWLMRIQWQVSKTTSLFVQLREENKLRNSPGTDQNVYQLHQIRKNNYWINLDYHPAEGLKMKTRLQGSSFKAGSQSSRGMTLLQDISYQKGKLRCTARYALFDTDDYDNRQYVYEHDVWLSYALPAYHGKGVRKYLLLQYKMNRTYTFWIRYGHTRFADRESIGTGVDMISGNQQNDIKFEMRVRF